MSDQKVTTGTKTLGRRRSFSDSDAERAHRLYVTEDLTGDQVEAIMKRPRTTVLEMVKHHEGRIERGEVPDPSTTGVPTSEEVAAPLEDTSKAGTI